MFFHTNSYEFVDKILHFLYFYSATTQAPTKPARAPQIPARIASYPKEKALSKLKSSSLTYYDTAFDEDDASDDDEYMEQSEYRTA